MQVTDIECLNNNAIGSFMAYISGASTSFFSKESYQAYLQQKKLAVNTRLREEDVTFFEAMLSKEADLSQSSDGEKVLDFIKGYN